MPRILAVAAALLPFLSASPARSQITSRDSSVIALLEQQVEDAVVARNVPFLDSIYAPTFVFKHSTGDLETRAARMAALQQPRSANAPGRMLGRTVDSLDIEVHRDIALSTGRIHIRRAGGEPRWQNYTIRYVRVYVRNATTGRWQLLTHHSFSDAQGPPPPYLPTRRP